MILIPTASIFDNVENNDDDDVEDDDEDDDDDEDEELEPGRDSSLDSPWLTKPIYHLPPYCIQWKLPRSEAKALCKSLANAFQTTDSKRSPSIDRGDSLTKKSTGIKPGKGRRHGGYGIG